MCLHTSLLETVGKREIACNKQFLLFPQCLLPAQKTFCHFYKIWNCHGQNLSVWKRLKFVVWERVNFGKSNILSSGNIYIIYSVFYFCFYWAWDQSSKEKIGKWKLNLGVRHFEGSNLMLWRALLKGGNIYTQYSCQFFYRKLKSDNFIMFSSDLLESQDPY